MTPEEIKRALAAPFDSADLKFFPAATATRDGKTMGKVATYADTRTYMERLDAVVPGAWTTRYRFLDPVSAAVECTMGIDYGNGFVYRSDVGYPNEARDADDASKEPLKAAYSDAFKRAAVQHGIGRFIYSIELERDWLEVDQHKRFVTQPRPKGAPSQQPARSVAAPPSQPAAALSQPSSNATTGIGAWWGRTRNDGFGRQEIMDAYWERFKKEPKDLTAEERDSFYEDLLATRKQAVPA